MSCVLAIVLVINSSRGHHFVFNYPHAPCRRDESVSSLDDPETDASLPVEYADSVSSKSPGKPGTTTPSVNTSTKDAPRLQPPRRLRRRWTGNDADDSRNYIQSIEISEPSSVLGYSTQFLSNMLTPKRTLCDKRFQLSVDDLTFLGHPVYVGGDNEAVIRKSCAVGISSKPGGLHQRVLSASTVPTGLGIGPTAFAEQPIPSPSPSPDIQFPANSGTAPAPLIPTYTALSTAPSGVPSPAVASPDSISGPTQSQTTSTVRKPAVLPSAPQSSPPPETSTTTSTSSRQYPLSITPKCQSALAGLMSRTTSHSSVASSNNPPSSSSPLLSSSMNLTSPFHTVPSTSPAEPSSAPASTSTIPNFTNSAPTTSTTTTSAIHLTSFHLAFILEVDPLEKQKITEELYKHVIKKMTLALRHEQQRCQYVGAEAEKILKIKEEAVTQGFTFEEEMSSIMSASSLARDICHVYHAIINDKIARVIVNGYIDLSLQIPKIRLPIFSNGVNSFVSTAYNSSPSNDKGTSYPFNTMARTPSVLQRNSYGGMKDAKNGADVFDEGGCPRLSPYQTLLLLEDKEDIIKEIPRDASIILVRLVQELTPTKCFAELHTLFDCSLAQIYRLAAHLVYWRKARVIDVISPRNVYVVSPKADLKLLPSIMSTFQRQFPELHLPTLLSSLSIPRPYSALIPARESRSLYLDVITFLLKIRYVIQLHTYIYLTIPPHVKLGLPLDEYERLGYGSALSAVAGDFARIISNPAQATEMERDWILKLAKGEKGEVAELFQRLLQYFNGTRHAEEIIFRENLSRRDLKVVLSRFPELITVLHFDEN